MAIDYTTPAGQVRLLIADVDPVNQILDDLQVAGFLQVEGQVIKRAAAAALEAISTSEALISKVIKTQDLATDGTKVAAELRARAADLRQQVYDDADDQGGFTVVDYREYPIEWLRASAGAFPGELAR